MFKQSYNPKQYNELVSRISSGKSLDNYAGPSLSFSSSFSCFHSHTLRICSFSPLYFLHCFAWVTMQNKFSSLLHPATVSLASHRNPIKNVLLQIVGPHLTVCDRYARGICSSLFPYCCCLKVKVLTMFIRSVFLAAVFLFQFTC